LSSLAAVIFSSACRTRHGQYCGDNNIVDPHYLLHSIQHVGLAVFISVCTDTEVDSARIFVGFECLSNTWSECSQSMLLFSSKTDHTKDWVGGTSWYG
jgi:hypothetical protein